MINNNLSVLEWLLAFFLVINGNSVYRACIGMDTPITVITAVLIACVWLLSRSLMPVKKILMTPFLIMGVSFVYMVITKHQMMTFFFVYIIGLPLLIDYFYHCIVYRRFEILFQKLSSIIVILTVLSLLLWYLGPITNQIDENCSIRIRWEHAMTLKGYWWLLYKTQYEDGTFIDATYVWRNSSIFTEAPMYNLWLCYSLVVEVFMRRHLKPLNIIIIALGIATTYSSTGILCTILIGSLYFYVKSDNSFFKKIPTYLKICFFIVIIYIGYQWSIEIMIMKSDTSSYISRMRDYELSFEMFKQHPIVGIGFGEQLNHTMGYSNSLVSILAQGGIILFSLIYAPVLYGAIKSYRKSHYMLLGLSIFFVYISTSTVFHNRYLFILIPTLFYAYSEYDLSKKRLK